MWQLPEKWISEEVNNFEENEVNINIIAKIASEKMEKRINKNEEEDSDDDDDINGWSYRNY